MQTVIFPIANLSLPIYITGLGFDCEQKGISRENGYDSHQWIQTKSGSGFLEYENNIYKIGEGDGFLLPPNASHSYYPSKQGWEQEWVAFSGSHVSAYLEALHLEQFFITSGSGFISQLIKRAIDDSSNSLFAVRHSIIITQILNELAKSDFNNNEYLSITLDYINSNYKNELTIIDLAKTQNITPQHFCKVFYEKMQMRPFEYLTRVRLSKSKELMLQSSELKIEEIASVVGFSSGSYFCKVFKKYEGVTPMQFKSAYSL